MHWSDSNDHKKTNGFCRPSSSCISSHHSCHALGLSKQTCSSNVLDDPQDPRTPSAPLMRVNYACVSGPGLAECIPDDTYIPAPAQGWASLGTHLHIELESAISWNLTLTPFFTKKERDFALQPTDPHRSLNTFFRVAEVWLQDGVLYLSQFFEILLCRNALVKFQSQTENKASFRPSAS